MKVALLTTLPSLTENKRIKDEVENLNHEFELVDLSGFNFAVTDDGIDAEGITDLSSDVVILRGVFLSIKTISALVSGIREEEINVFDNNFLEHRYSIDKVTDIAKLALAGIKTPRTFYSRDLDDYPEMAEKLGYPLIIKSTRMGKGAHVFKIESQDEIEEFMEEIQTEGKKAKNYLLQEFVDYKHDLRVLVIGENIFTMERIPAEGEFRANFSLGGSVEKFDLDESGRKLAIKALDAIDMSVGGVDILIDKDDNKFVLEVNHTAGFVGMEKALSKNIGKVFVEHAIARAR